MRIKDQAIGSTNENPQRGTTTKRADYLFVMTLESMYLIPAEEVDGKAKLTLFPKYDQYKI